MSEPLPSRRERLATGAIKSGARPQCPLCGANGTLAHTLVPDRFFGSPGLWNFRKCTNDACDFAWIDPMPSKDQLEQAYAGYYTHAAPLRRTGLLRPLYERMKRGYLARKLGYDEHASDFDRWLGFFARFLPEKRHQMEAASMHLHADLRGRILEIGCGNGNILAQLARLGWDAWGVDFDPFAVEQAKRTSATDVRTGTLEEQNYPTEHFDAIASVHALEHIPDPTALFEECIRILRPGGQLVVSTPNWHCLTHQAFGGHWRGLEPPRHLHLFTRRSLRNLLEQVGFEILSLETTTRGATYGHQSSAAVKSPEQGEIRRALAALLHSIRVQGRLSTDPDAGDELLALGRRPDERRS